MDLGIKKRLFAQAYNSSLAFLLYLIFKFIYSEADLVSFQTEKQTPSISSNVCKSALSVSFIAMHEHVGVQRIEKRECYLCKFIDPKKYSKQGVAMLLILIAYRFS